MSTLSSRAVVQVYDEDRRKGRRCCCPGGGCGGGRGGDWNAKGKERPSELLLSARDRSLCPVPLGALVPRLTLERDGRNSAGCIKYCSVHEGRPLPT